LRRMPTPERTAGSGRLRLWLRALMIWSMRFHS